jgi:hypothetical protein
MRQSSSTEVLLQADHILEWAEGEMNDTHARLWHPWLRINRVLRVMRQTRWSAEAWPRALLVRRCGVQLDSRQPSSTGEMRLIGLVALASLCTGAVDATGPSRNGDALVEIRC